MTNSPETASQVIHPPQWAPAHGYSNGMIAEGRWIVLAGQIGWNPATSAFETDDFAAQTKQALQNIADLLSAANAEPRHLVRLTWFITDRDAYLSARRDIGKAYRDVLGKHFPPMSVVVVSGLIEPRALVEIEATAVVPR